MLRTRGIPLSETSLEWVLGTPKRNIQDFPLNTKIKSTQGPASTKQSKRGKRRERGRLRGLK